MRAAAVLHGRRGTNHHGHVGANRAELIGTDDLLARPIRAQHRYGSPLPGEPTPPRHRLLGVDLAFVEEVVQLLADDRWVQNTGVGAVLQAVLIVLCQLLLVRLTRGGDLGNPGVPLPAGQAVAQCLEKRLLVADDTQLERPVAAEISALGMHPDGADVGVHSIVGRTRHAVLADEDDQVGAHERAWRQGGGEPVLVGEMAAHGPARERRDVILLHRGQERVPRLPMEDAVPGDEERALGFRNQLDGLRDVLRRRDGPRLGAVLGLVVVVGQEARILEAHARHLAGEIEVHRTGHAGLELAKRVRAVLVNAVGKDHALAVFLDAVRDRLLIHRLDAGFAVLACQLDVAGKHEQRYAREVGGRDARDHVREARTFGARARDHFSRGARVTVGGGCHVALGPSAVARHARRCDGVRHGVVPGAAEHRRQAFLLAQLREDVGAHHAVAFEAAGERGLAERRGDLLGNAQGGDGRGRLLRQEILGTEGCGGCGDRRCSASQELSSRGARWGRLLPIHVVLFHDPLL